MEHPDCKDKNIQFVAGVGLATAVQFFRKQCWCVDIGFHDIEASISFLTDPTGVKEMFKFRGISDGKKRRDALIHWVTNHWRQNRYDPEIEIYVRSFLRGATVFSWFGMNVEIIIPKCDTERIEKLKLERNVMRLAGTDRRAVPKLEKP